MGQAEALTATWPRRAIRCGNVACTVWNAEHIDLHEVHPLARIGMTQRRQRTNAGVGPAQVDAPKALHREGHCTLAVLGPGHIAGEVSTSPPPSCAAAACSAGSVRSISASFIPRR